MSTAFPLPGAAPALTDGAQPTQQALDLSIALGLALVLRLVFFNGAFGTDDLTYILRAQEISQGVWTSADYNGALRYAYNLPTGLIFALLGVNWFTANLWPLLCSLGEVWLVYRFTLHYFGRRAALLAALVLAFLPINVGVATRIHTDPILSFFLTASFVGLDAALRRGSTVTALLTGVMLGAVFWTKELAALAYLAFLPFVWHFRRRPDLIMAVLGGLILMFALHGLLMWWLASDPLHAFKTVIRQLQNSFIRDGNGRDDAGYYLHYLFVDVRHVGLVGFAALLGIWTMRRRLSGVESWVAGPGRAGFVVSWLLVMLVLFSVFPVSLSPLRFTLKQSNYLALFAAPLSVLAGVGLAGLSRPWLRHAAVGVLLASCGFLVALGQADYRNFTANSKAALLWQLENPQARLVGNVSLVRFSVVWNLVNPQVQTATSYVSAAETPAEFAALAAQQRPLYAVVDRHTADWMARGKPVTAPQACWERVHTLAPADLGFGNAVAAAAASAAAALPGRLGQVGSAQFERLARPEPAQLYRLPANQLSCDAAKAPQAKQ